MLLLLLSCLLSCLVGQMQMMHVPLPVRAQQVTKKGMGGEMANQAQNHFYLEGGAATKPYPYQSPDEERIKARMHRLVRDSMRSFHGSRGGAQLGARARGSSDADKAVSRGGRTIPAVTRACERG